MSNSRQRSLDVVLRRLSSSKTLKSFRGKIAYVLLYGSYVEGRQGVLSDIDILVEFRDRKYDIKRLGMLASMLEEELKVRVDIVEGIAAPPSLRYKAFNKGVAVMVLDKHMYIDDKVKATMEWLDIKGTFVKTAEKMIKETIDGVAWSC